MALVLMEARFVMKRLVWKGLAFIMENGRVKYLSINLSTPTAAPTRKGNNLQLYDNCRWIQNK